MICPKCGKTIEDDARFCSGCGEKIQAVTPNAAPAPEMPRPVVTGNNNPAPAMPRPVVIKNDNPAPAMPRPVAVTQSTERATKTQTKEKSGNGIPVALIAVLFLIFLVLAAILVWMVFFKGNGKKKGPEKAVISVSQSKESERNTTTEKATESSSEQYEAASSVEEWSEVWESVEESSYAEPEPSSSVIAEEPSEYILPDSAVRYLTYSDLYNLTKDDCRLARNELYARHGRKFTDEALQAYFNSKSWYYPSIDPEDFTESMLNDIEVYNRDLIVQFEKEMGYR